MECPSLVPCEVFLVRETGSKGGNSGPRHARERGLDPACDPLAADTALEQEVWGVLSAVCTEEARGCSAAYCCC